ncbi:oligosaccharide flippase family protein [Scatolibacter rhodanostii]|uniref:oligosaccharide flippase family protein n=1 Tax=Scatolibacter rhodanostii TaxID=2014781 RepID=UPI000C068FDC|nr:oligosaccharide flippase family protein [Scatolibacter rhodanostii]
MQINQRKAGVFLSYLSMGISSVVYILYTPFMIRILGKSEYGLYNLVFSVVSSLGLLSFGFGSAYMRFYSRYHVKEDYESIAKLNGMFLVIYLVISSITILVGVVLVVNVQLIFKNSLTNKEMETARVLMALMVFNVAISFPASVFDANVTAHEKYFFQRIVNLLRSVLNPFLTLPLLLMGFKSISLVVVTTILTVGSLLINIWYCVKILKIRFSFKNFDFSIVKEVGIFSFYIFLNQIVDQINWSSDKFILGMLLNTSVVAVYSVGAQLNTFYMNFSTAISTVFIPKINLMVAETNDNKSLTKIFTKIGRIQFFVLSLIGTGLIFLGRPFIRFYSGAGYENAYMVSLFLILPITVPLIQNIGIEIQRAKNMHKFRSVLYILIALVNIILSVILIPRYGEIGAAFGTGLTLIIGNGLIMNWYYQTKVGLDIFYFWKEILRFVPALIAPTIVGVLMLLFVDMNKITTFLLCGVIYVLVFVLSMWILGLNQYEKDMIKNLKKVFKKN